MNYFYNFKRKVLILLAEEDAPQKLTESEHAKSGWAIAYDQELAKVRYREDLGKWEVKIAH